MKMDRLWLSLRLCLARDGYKRAKIAKKAKVYKYIGNNVMIQPRKIPLYSQLICFHNNIQVASKVTFITHDVTHNILNRLIPDEEFHEKVGCINIMDNVFIGSNSTILYNVQIGPNAIVAAGSVVTKDVPENTIVGGNPAKVIGTFDDYVNKRILNPNEYIKDLQPKGEKIKQDLARTEWERFHRERD